MDKRATLWSRGAGAAAPPTTTTHLITSKIDACGLRRHRRPGTKHASEAAGIEPHRLCAVGVAPFPPGAAPAADSPRPDANGGDQ
jgi:hypothetical protein